MVVDDSTTTAFGIAAVIHRIVERVDMRTPEAITDASPDELAGYDRVIVDIWDDEAEQTEVATDLLSGIEVLERIHDANPDAVTIAVVPLLRDPLLRRRVIDAKPHAVVASVRLTSIGAIVHMATDCGTDCAEHQPEPVSDRSLLVLGFDGASPNDVARVYRDSDLYGELRLDVTKESLGRRKTTYLRNDLIAAGILGRRWPEVTSVLMRILGR